MISKYRISQRIGITLTLLSTALCGHAELPSSTSWCGLGLSQHDSATTNSWELSANKEKIDVYTRLLGTSDYKAVHASMLVPAPAAAVIAAFGQAYTESNGCAQWRSQCKQSTVLESLSAESSILHLVLDLPWPLSDRDLVIKYTVSTDKKSGITRLAGQSLDNYYPLQEQIRAQTMLIYCIKPISHNQTNVVYEMQTQLNGDVPVSLFNTQVVNSTLKDMAELRKTALEAVENLKDG